MRSYTWKALKFLLFAVVLSANAITVARADSVGVAANGVCGFGTCPPVPLQAGGSVHEDYSFITTLANGDEFRVAGHIAATNFGNGGFTPGDAHRLNLVQYLGNARGGASQVDSVTVTTLGGFQLNLDPAFDFFNTGPISGGYGPGTVDGSSIHGNFTVNGTPGASFGPFIAPIPIGGTSDPATFPLSSVGGVLIFGADTTFSFAAGTPVGAYMYTGVIPEPTSVLMLGSGLLILYLLRRRGNVRIRHVSQTY